MELYLLRHGIAVDAEAFGVRNDRERPLTEEGIKRTRKVARALKVLQLDFDLILTSPYVRARQTAEIVVEEFRIPRRLRESQALLPGSQPRDLVRELIECGETQERVMLVGHEPGLSRFASLLICGRPDADLTMKKAGLCLLMTGDLVAGRCASLELLIPPRVLLRMGR